MNFYVAPATFSFFLQYFIYFLLFSHDVSLAIFYSKFFLVLGYFLILFFVIFCELLLFIKVMEQVNNGFSRSAFSNFLFSTYIADKSSLRMYCKCIVEWDFQVLLLLFGIVKLVTLCFEIFHRLMVCRRERKVNLVT